MNAIDSLLNRVTMYRLTLWCLLGLVGVAAAFGFLRIIPFFSGADILFTAAYAWIVCAAASTLFSRLFRVRPNPESSSITALIVALIFGPVPPVLFASSIRGITLACIAAVASKYLVLVRGRHLFNPAAFGALAAAFFAAQGASWWIGSQAMLPFIAIAGLLITRKVNRSKDSLIFLAAYFCATFTLGLVATGSVNLPNWFASLSPIVFLSTVMLVEPLTAPAGEKNRYFYATFVGIAAVAFGSIPNLIPFPLELALLFGNIAARILEASPRYLMTLKRKEEYSPTITGFWFNPSQRITFFLGQYLEWTLPHANPDDRGSRRYFTIASSPTEQGVLLVTRFSPEKSSTFKAALHGLQEGDTISAEGIAGEFTLPPDPGTKMVWVAGGVGITPFRSITKFLIDTNGSRDVVLFYGARKQEDIVFRDIFEEARAHGIKTIYTVGNIALEMVRREVSDYAERTFYVSGPEPMVRSFSAALQKGGIAKGRIKRDFFPGYADE